MCRTVQIHVHAYMYIYIYVYINRICMYVYIYIYISLSLSLRSMVALAPDMHTSQTFAAEELRDARDLPEAALRPGRRPRIRAPKDHINIRISHLGEGGWQKPWFVGSLCLCGLWEPKICGLRSIYGYCGV